MTDKRESGSTPMARRAFRFWCCAMSCWGESSNSDCQKKSSIDTSRAVAERLLRKSDFSISHLTPECRHFARKRLYEYRNHFCGRKRESISALPRILRFDQHAEGMVADLRKYE